MGGSCGGKFEVYKWKLGLVCCKAVKRQFRWS